jgi:flagellar motor switch protein FliG
VITNIPTAETISPLRKAAVLLVTLGEEASADLLRHLSGDEVHRLSQEVARLGSLPNELTEKVLDEFYKMAVARQYANQGGVDFTKKLLARAFGPDESRRLIDHLVRSMGASLASFDSLQRTDPQQLARFIHNEHPQTIALILSHLLPGQAAALLASLPPELRPDVALRMASLDQISPEIISKIAGVISQKMKNIGGFSREAYGGVRAVSDICNRLDSDMSSQILSEIDMSDPTVATTIRNLMFVFEDILMLDEPAMNEVIGKVDRKLLITALKGTSEQLKDHFTRRMSTRAKEMLLEDLDALGPVKIKDVEAAQQQVVAVIRQLEQQGVVSLRGSVGEQYVV